MIDHTNRICDPIISENMCAVASNKSGNKIVAAILKQDHVSVVTQPCSKRQVIAPNTGRSSLPANEDRLVRDRIIKKNVTVVAAVGVNEP